MDIQELKDDEMEFIVGGSSDGAYMTQLSSLLHNGPYGQYFKISYNRPTGVAHLSMPANDKTFEHVAQRANTLGDVTFTGPDGQSQTFTAAQLQAMI